MSKIEKMNLNHLTHNHPTQPMKQEQETELYKGFELFSDPCYYDMIAVRKQGEKSFMRTNHFNTFDEARRFVDGQEQETRIRFFNKHDYFACIGAIWDKPIEFTAYRTALLIIIKPTAHEN